MVWRIASFDHDISLAVGRIASLGLIPQNLDWVSSGQQRPVVFARYSAGQNLKVGLQPNRDGPGFDQGAGFRVHERTAACRQNVGRFIQQSCDNPPLPLSKRRFPKVSKDVGDGTPRRRLDLLIGIFERQIQGIG